jgi:cold shock protein
MCRSSGTVFFAGKGFGRSPDRQRLACHSTKPINTMKNVKSLLLAVLLLVPVLMACEEKTDVVESGTYQGVIDEVEADKSEIYVKTDDNKRLELYFNDSTQLTQNGNQVPFEQLREGGRVEVDVEKVGNRLEPLAVRILD